MSALLNTVVDVAIGQGDGSRLSMVATCQFTVISGRQHDAIKSISCQGQGLPLSQAEVYCCR
ncbi:MAG: hypothetical protein AAF622_03995 [Cyanobacteria bacterium P01_C01_bin.147]